MSGFEVSVQPTRFRVSVLPAGDPRGVDFAIDVEYTGGWHWAVVHAGRVLGRDGVWRVEPEPDALDEAWLAGHRFGLEDAIRAASAAAPHVTVGGVSAADVLQGRAGEAW